MITHHFVRTLFIGLLVASLFILLTWPVWRWLWQEWLGNDYYSHGPLILVVAGYLGWRQWSLTPKPIQGDNRGLVLTTLAIFLFVYFISDKALYLATLTMLMLLASLVWVFGGLKLLRRLAFPLCFLMLMVPLPFVERTTLPLALWTGLCSGTLVRWFGLDAVISGAAVTLPNASLTIGAQCSGINSIIALFSLTTLAAYALHGPWWGRLGLAILAIPLALLGNILRVSNLLVVARYLGAEAAFRFYHDYSGPVFFIVVLLLLIPLSRLLQCKTLRFEVL